jgi:hypothetical protein
LSNAVFVAAGASCSFAVQADGIVVAWGEKTAGQTYPPPDLTNVISVAAGATHGLALVGSSLLGPWTPATQVAACSGNSFCSTIGSRMGSTYMLEFKNAINASGWSALWPLVLGDGGKTPLVDTNAPWSPRFYRVHQR